MSQSGTRPAPDVSTEQLIEQLSGGLRPVLRLPSPALRAAAWLALVLAVAALLAARADLPAVAARVASFTDMWLAVAGSVATAVLASLAACMVSVPGRSRRWAWLPLPGAALWLGSSGLGCLRATALLIVHPATFHDAITECLPFILEFSALLAVPLAALLWWARPLRPGLVAGLAGLAVAAASASLLWFFHPFDASIEDLVVHILAVLLVVGICRLVAAIPRRAFRRTA